MMDYIVLDVSGTRYHLLKELIEKHPDSLLYKIMTSTFDFSTLIPFVKRRKSENHFFIQRSPLLFDACILPIYITKKIHLPDWVCPEIAKEEIDFWQLQSEFCNSCYFESTDSGIGSISNSDRVQAEHSEKLKFDLTENDVANNICTSDVKKKEQTFREILWNICENPSSSKKAATFSLFSVIFILLSISTLIISSIPELQYCKTNLHIKSPSNRTSSTTIDHPGEIILNANHENNTIDNHDNFFSDCTGTKTFEILQLICICWFTVELLIRFAVTDNRLKFAKSAQNIIDFLSTFPFYVETIFWAIDYNMQQFSRARSALSLLRFLRVAKVLAVLKLARYFRELQIFGETLKSAGRELFMLVLFIFINLLMLCSLVYHFEKEEPGTPFVSIPASFWWGIATLTTVGYGDIAPKSVGGKLVGGFGCVAGVVVMALPVSVLVDHFTKAYKRAAEKSKIGATVVETPNGAVVDHRHINRKSSKFNNNNNNNVNLVAVNGSSFHHVNNRVSNCKDCSMCNPNDSVRINENYVLRTSSKK